MNHRTRLAAAVSGTVGLFVIVQLGALALVDPYVAANAQPVDDPSDPGNVLLFFGVILVATAGMLAAIKYDLEQVIRGFVVLACGWITWLVLSTVATSLAPAAAETTVETVLSWLAVLLPVLAGLLMVGALLVHPEWYVVDAAGMLLGAGAAGLFGLAFTPQLTIAFLVVLAVYDAVSVYGTEHMLDLAEGVSDLNLPVMLVIPTTLQYSLLDDSGPESLADDSAADGESTDANDTNEEATEREHSEEEHEDEHSEEEPAGVRDALYIGLGDAVMPTILVASAAVFLRDAAPLYDVPLVAINAPALGAAIGTLVGLLVLLWLVLKGRAHAGLPLLNGGAILGFVLGALAAGMTVSEAVGLPL